MISILSLRPLCGQYTASRTHFVRHSSTKIRAALPIYFSQASSGAGVFTVTAAAGSVPLGTTAQPLAAFKPTLVAGDTNADGTTSGDVGFTAAEPYRIPDPPSVFAANPLFVHLLLDTVAETVHNCPVYNGIAEGELFYGGATLHIYDLRAPPPYGRIPDVQDILGTVRIQQPVHNDGPNVPLNKKYKVPAIVPGSFEPNSMYRLLTRNGFFTLSDYLHKRVVIAASS